MATRRFAVYEAGQARTDARKLQLGRRGGRAALCRAGLAAAARRALSSAEPDAPRAKATYPGRTGSVDTGGSRATAGIRTVGRSPLGGPDYTGAARSAHKPGCHGVSTHRADIPPGVHSAVADSLPYDPDHIKSS